MNIILEKRTKPTNKLLAFSQRRIPYIPELKEVCGSVCATIVMQQLEYWFANNTEGFYKFLNPCEHQRYVIGDSWTEELFFTAHEFRSSFAKIGIAYRSKKQLNEVVAKGEDPFQGKFYLSYIDVRQGLTYYIRNHEVVDALLSELLNNFTPKANSCAHAELDISGDKIIKLPEIKNVDLQKLNSLISYNKETLEEHTKTTAAKEQAPEKQEVAAAAAFSCESNLDAVIADNLTSKQQEIVRNTINAIARDKTDAEKTNLCEEVIHTILQKDSFTQAGNDFFKKLNTIKKIIKTNQWTAPVTLINTKQDSIKQSLQPLKDMVGKLSSERAHWLNMLSSFCEEKQREQVQGLITKIDEKLSIAKKDLMAAENIHTKHEGAINEN